MPTTDWKRRRRFFSMMDTFDSKSLMDLLNEKLGEYSPKEIPIPEHIKYPDSYFGRWDLGVFHEALKEYYNSHDDTNDSPYVGDIDSFIPFKKHHAIFIDEKESLSALKLEVSFYFSILFVSLDSLCPDFSLKFQLFNIFCGF